MSYQEIRDHLNSYGPKYDGITDPIPNTNGGALVKNYYSGNMLQRLRRCIHRLLFLEPHRPGLAWNRSEMERTRGLDSRDNAHPTIINMTEWEQIKAVMKPIVQRNR